MYFFNFIELFKSVFLWLKSKMARIYLQRKFPTLRDHIIEKTTRNFSLVARYLLKFTRCSLLLVGPLVTRCKICSLLVAEVARCKKSLVTRCRSCSLQKITRYSLQNSLVTRCRSCLLQKITRYSLQNLLATRCRSGVTFCNFMKKKLHHRCFPVNFCETLRALILWNFYERLLLKIISKHQQTLNSFLRQVFTLIWLSLIELCYWIVWLNWIK